MSWVQWQERKVILCMGAFSGQALTDMEVEFSRCIQFLASFLNNIIKRGSFPHGTSLCLVVLVAWHCLQTSLCVALSVH